MIWIIAQTAHWKLNVSYSTLSGLVGTWHQGYQSFSNSSARLRSKDATHGEYIIFRSSITSSTIIKVFLYMFMVHFSMYILYMRGVMFVLIQNKPYFYLLGRYWFTHSYVWICHTQQLSKLFVSSFISTWLPWWFCAWLYMEGFIRLLNTSVARALNR